jgi:hypothetical protein
MAELPTPQEVISARHTARDVLIGYLCAPPQNTDAQVRSAVKALAKELDTSYERAWRYLLTGDLS